MFNKLSKKKITKKKNIFEQQKFPTIIILNKNVPIKNKLEIKSSKKTIFEQKFVLKKIFEKRNSNKKKYFDKNLSLSFSKKKLTNK